MRSNAVSIKEFTRKLLDRETASKDNQNDIVEKRLNSRPETIELDRKLVKKSSKSDITQIQTYDTDTDSDDDNNGDDDNNERDDDFGRNSVIQSSKIRNLLHRRQSKRIYKTPSIKQGLALLKHSSFMKLIQEKEKVPNPVDTSNIPPVSSPSFSHKSNKKTSAMYHTESQTFVKLSQGAIKFLIRLQAFNLLTKTEYDDDKMEDEILDITVRFKDALNTFNREIIKIGMALPLDFMDNGTNHSHYHHYPGTRIFYFVCQRGSRQVMHILADCLYKSKDDINIPLILSGLNLLLLPIEALKTKMKQMENNESLDWSKEMIKAFLNWSAETFQEMASTGAIPLLTKIIQQTDKCLNPVIQLVAYTLLQQLVIASEACMSQLLYEPPIKEKQNHSTVIDRLREENKKKEKKISDEELLLKMKKTVESEFRQTLHEKDLRESLYRRPFKKAQTLTKSLNKEKNGFIILRTEHFSFIDYGGSSCISIILTSAIANQNRHEVVGNFASLIWVMTNAVADEEFIKNISMVLSNKIKIDKLKEPYKSYKDTKRKLTLVQSKEAVAELNKPSSELMQISVLDFLLRCTKRYRAYVIENMEGNKTSNVFVTYTKICKALYSLMLLSDFICFTVMKSSKSLKQVVQSFSMFTSSRSMKNDIEHLRQKISMAREDQAQKDHEFDQPRIATSTLKRQDGLGNSNALHRPRSAPSIGRRATNAEETNRDTVQNKRTTSSIRPKSAGAVESFSNMHLIGQAPILPKNIQLQIPTMEYPISILSPEEKRKKVAEHEKAVEMARLLQDALTPKTKTSDENDESPVVIEPISFDIENSITSKISSKIHIESDSSTLQKFEQNIDYNFDVFQDEDFDKTIQDVLIIRSMRNAINDSKDMIDFHMTISNMNINLSHEQINELYTAIKNNKNHKDCLKILNARNY